MFKGIKGYLQYEDSKKPKKSIDPDAFPILRARELLSLYRPQMPITELPEILNLDEMQFQTHCSTLIDRFAEFVQSLPETQNSYFSKPGGILIHGLHRALLATKLSRAYFLPEEMQENEHLTQRQMLWAYAVFSAGLLYNIGKVIVDFSVTILDRFGGAPKTWNPWEGAMVGQGTDFKYEFNTLNQDEFRKRVTLTIAKELMPQQSFLWIASDTDVLAAWLAMLEEDERRGGLLGILILRADAELIQRNLLEQKIPQKVETKPGSKLGEGFSTFGKTQKTAAGFGMSDIAIATDFLSWVREGLEKGTIKANDAKSGPVQVDGGALVTEKVIKDFISEHAHKYRDGNVVTNALAKADLIEIGPNNALLHDYAIVKQTQQGEHKATATSQQPTQSEIVKGIVIKNENLLFPQTLTAEAQRDLVIRVPVAVGMSSILGQTVNNVLQAEMDVKPITPGAGR